MDPTEREVFWREWNRVLAIGDDVGDVEFRLRHADGNWRWFRNRFRTFKRGVDGAVEEVIGTLLEVTELHTRLQELRLAKARSVRAESMAALGHWEFNLRREGWWSDQLYRICDVSSQDFAPTARASILLAHRHDRLALLNATRRLVEDLRPFAIEVQLKACDAGQRASKYIRIAGEPQYSEQQELIGFAGTAQDITARKEIERKLAQAERLESLGSLAGGISHDFNNLLTVINGYADLVCEALPTDSLMLEMIREVRRAGERAAELTKRLLTFSRSQATFTAAVDLNKVLRDSEGMLRRLIREDIAIETKYDPSTPTIQADASQIIQVIINLAANARDAMPSGGLLEIETASRWLDEVDHPTGTNLPGRYAVLSVSDNGMGMNAATLSRIFDPFFTTKENAGGTGLGLSTVYGIVKQAMGWIDVHSKVGSGTCFQLYFPECMSSQPQDCPVETEVAGDGDEEVLVVEDQAEVRRLTCEILVARGYRVHEASSGRQALALMANAARESRVIVTDVVMPGMNGPELYAELRKQFPRLRALFVSGYAGEQLRDRRSLGVGTDFLLKPFSPRALASKVRRLLNMPLRRHRIVVLDGRDSDGGYLTTILASAGYEVMEVYDEDGVERAMITGRIDLVIFYVVIASSTRLNPIIVLRKRLPDLRILLISGPLDGESVNVVETCGVWRSAATPITAENLLTLVYDAIASERDKGK